MTDITKATPRPWRWEWTSSNEITIYHNDGVSFEAIEVATILCDDKDYRAQSEADAELICRLVNDWRGNNQEATT